MHKKAALVKSVQLRPHQEQAIQKYLKNNNRQILAHSLGSGKTITSLGAVERSGAKKALILTPAALQKNYQDSIDKFVTPDSKNKYVVMSYEKFRMNPEKFVEEIQPDTMVVDEYHRQKDPAGVSFNAIKKVRPKIKNFLGLTGTVMQNSPQEIFPLINLETGDFKNGVSMNRQQFNDRYTKVEKVYPKGFAGLKARLLNRFGEKRVLTNESDLKKIIQPNVDKNLPTPEFMAEFPKQEIVDIDAEMTPKQQKIYNYFMNKDLNFVDRWKIKYDLPPSVKNSNKIFTKLIRARQVSDSPTVLSKELQDADPMEYSGKLKESYKNLLAHLEKDPVNKAMIYSNFTSAGLNPLSAALTKSKIPFGEFSGQVTKTNKNNDVTDFNAGKKRVLLVSPSGAEGLDLKGVTLQQILDPHWNNEKMNQILGRAKRYKSHIALPPEKRNVRVERYRSTLKPSLLKRVLGKKRQDSIDQYIYNRAQEKQDLVDQVNNLI